MDPASIQEMLVAAEKSTAANTENVAAHYQPAPLDLCAAEPQEDGGYDSSNTASEDESDDKKTLLRVVRIRKKTDERQGKQYQTKKDERAGKAFARAAAKNYPKLFRHRECCFQKTGLPDPFTGEQIDIPAMIRRFGTFDRDLISTRKHPLSRESELSARPRSFQLQLNHPFSAHQVTDGLLYYVNFLENDDRRDKRNPSEEEKQMWKRSRTLSQLTPTATLEFWLSAMGALYKEREQSGDFYLYHKGEDKKFRAHKFVLEMSGFWTKLGDPAGKSDTMTMSSGVDSSVIEAVIAGAYRQDYTGGVEMPLEWHAQVFAFTESEGDPEGRLAGLLDEILERLKYNFRQAMPEGDRLDWLVRTLRWSFATRPHVEIFELILDFAVDHLEILRRWPGFEELQKESYKGDRIHPYIAAKLSIFRNASKAEDPRRGVWSSGLKDATLGGIWEKMSPIERGFGV